MTQSQESIKARCSQYQSWLPYFWMKPNVQNYLKNKLSSGMRYYPFSRSQVQNDRKIKDQVSTPKYAQQVQNDFEIKFYWYFYQGQNSKMIWKKNMHLKQENFYQQLKSKITWNTNKPIIHGKNIVSTAARASSLFSIRLSQPVCNNPESKLRYHEKVGTRPFYG